MIEPYKCKICEVPECNHAGIKREDTIPDKQGFYHCRKCGKIVEEELLNDR